MKKLTDKQKHDYCQVIWNDLTSMRPADSLDVFMVLADRFVSECPTAPDTEISARELMVKWLGRKGA